MVSGPGSHSSVSRWDKLFNPAGVKFETSKEKKQRIVASAALFVFTAGIGHASYGIAKLVGHCKKQSEGNVKANVSAGTISLNSKKKNNDTPDIKTFGDLFKFKTTNEEMYKNIFQGDKNESEHIVKYVEIFNEVHKSLEENKDEEWIKTKIKDILKDKDKNELNFLKKISESAANDNKKCCKACNDMAEGSYDLDKLTLVDIKADFKDIEDLILNTWDNRVLLYQTKQEELKKNNK